MVTFMVSAFWHGFYPWYYVLFFQAALVVEVTKDVFKSRCLFTFIPKFLWNPLGNILTMVVLNSIGLLQNAITWERGVGYLHATYGFT